MALASALLAHVPAHAGLQPYSDWAQESDQANAQLGTSVSTAGDVNNDGFSDLIVGAPGFSNGQSAEGKVWLYLGGPSGLSWAAWSFEVNQANANLGESVSCAGDVNGDGYDDVIVGAPGYSNGQTLEGRAYCFYGGASGLPASPNWTREGGVTGAHFGSELAPAGDVNGDGYDDVMVASPTFGVSQVQEGAVYLYFGGASGLNTSTGWSKEGNLSWANLGASLSTAGDVNADGYDDIVLGAPGYDDPTNNGAVWIYLGSSSGPAAVANFFVTGGTDHFFGTTVATTGDCNGDGFSDVMVKFGTGNPSYVYVYHGSSSGVDSGVDRIYSASGNSSLGLGMFAAGDTNGDGYADAVLGDASADTGVPGNGSEGAIYLFESMGSFGLATQATTTIYGEEGASGINHFGYQVTTAGDVNGDGFSDVAVADPNWDDGQSLEGKVWVYLGEARRDPGNDDWIGEANQVGGNFGSALATGDWNGDGYDDLAAGAYFVDNGQSDEGMAFAYYGGADGISGAPDWSADSDQANALYGGAIANAGDVNGDGFEDLLVSAVNWDNGQTNEGRVWMYLGSAGGLGGAAWTRELDQAGAWFGWSISTAGDVNGDGYADVIVGAPRYESGALSSEGGAFLYLGSPGGLAASHAWSYVGGEAGAELGYAVGCAGDVNGDGYSDVLVGAVDADHGQVDEGVVYVFHGGAAGLAATPAMLLEANQAGASFGASVAGAGDVNGDGYSDVIVGSPTYSNGASTEGLARVYRGSASGLLTTGTWNLEGGQSGARRGECVRSAGDVNGDGRSDVLVGTPYYSHAVSDEGRASVYFGIPLGVGSSTDFNVDGGESDCRLGAALAAGDVNGDGYSDVIVGAPSFDNDQSTEGRAILYLGNEHGLDRRVQQLRSNGSTPIALLGLSDADNSVRLSGEARTALGRGRVRAQWQVEESGPFPSDAPVSDAIDYDTGAPISGIGSRRHVVTPAITGLAANETHHWRLRFRGDSPYFPWSPWHSLPRSGATEDDFRTLPAATDAAVPDLARLPEWASITAVAPNPWRTAVALRLSLPHAANARLTVHDAQGRLVASLLDQRLSAGTTLIGWDGATLEGHAAPAGVYFARLAVDGRSAEARLVRLR